jgi:alpha-tubulin suppressor-like RCC1 family protein
VDVLVVSPAGTTERYEHTSFTTQDAPRKHIKSYRQLLNQYQGGNQQVEAMPCNDPQPANGSCVQKITINTGKCALLKSGRVYCWGNSFGLQLIGEIGPAADLSMGDDDLCILLATGVPMCYSGCSNVNSIAAPFWVKDVIQVSVFSGRVCVTHANYSIVCWGVDIGPPPNAVQQVGAVKVATSSRHTCALLRNGSVACWGDNTNGQSSPPQGLADDVEVYGSYVRIVSQW